MAFKELVLRGVSVPRRYPPDHYLCFHIIHATFAAELETYLTRQNFFKLPFNFWCQLQLTVLVLLSCLGFVVDEHSNQVYTSTHYSSVSLLSVITVEMHRCCDKGTIHLLVFSNIYSLKCDEFDSSL